MSACPAHAARWMGVRLRRSFAFTSPPAASSRVMASVSPSRAASCTVVAPAERRTTWRPVALETPGGRDSERGRYVTSRRFPTTRRYFVPGATRTTLGFGICPSFKERFLSHRAEP